MKQSTVRWGRLLRRSAALFMATLAMWALLLTAGGGGAASAVKQLGESATFVSALLRTELGTMGSPADDTTLTGWGALLFGQSALLRGNGAAVVQQLKGGGTLVDHPAGGSSAQSDPLRPQIGHSEDAQELPNLTTAPDTIVPRTLIPTGPEGYLYADGVYVFNRTDLTLDPAALSSAAVTIAMGDAAAPQVLIMHTHGTEAYTPDGTDVYTPTDPSRTLDSSQNMIRVGTEMKAVFESMGLSVLHDETPYDYPAYKGGYLRSGEAVKGYLAQYPSIKIVLDVHRDALVAADGTVYKTYTTIDGAGVAQIELVVGSPKGGDHPNWLENMTLAMKLQKSMNTLYPTLARPISINNSVYNQSLTNGSLLVEVGSHGNTLQESISAGRLFARAAGQVLLNLPK